MELLEGLGRFLYCAYCSSNGHSTQNCPSFSRVAQINYLEQLIPTHLKERFQITSRTPLHEGIGSAEPHFDPENATCLENLIPNTAVQRYRIRSCTPIPFVPKAVQTAYIQIMNTPEGVATALHKYGFVVSQKKVNNNYEILYEFVMSEGKMLLDQHGRVLGPEGLKPLPATKKKAKSK